MIVNANAAFDIEARTAILQDFLSGEILYEKEPDKSIYPASMTKIMTAIVAFDLLKSDQYTIEDGLPQSVVETIYQDKEGFLWIATQDGISRFDGYDFENFFSNPLTTTS